MKSAVNWNERYKTAHAAETKWQADVFVADVEHYIEQNRVDMGDHRSIHALGLWLAKRGWAKP